MINYFVYDGKPSTDFGVYIGGQATFGAPQRDVTKVSVAGRNGDLIRDNGRWKNIIIPYSIVIMDEFKERAEAFNAWLSSKSGYLRLEDTYHPEYYRMAQFYNGADYKTATFNDAGKTVISFDCKPQKYLVSGEVPVSFASEGSIFNPTLFHSNPLLKIETTGSEKVTVNGTRIDIGNYSGTIIIDSELQDCYDENMTQNLNSKVTFSNGKFPTLKPGKNLIEDHYVTNVTITGRWYEI